jgi:predicted Na+-dependent transporter
MGTAIFNAIAANVMGVFLTPLLAVWIMGAGKGVSLLGTLNKLWTVVILPLAIGQLCRRTPIRAVAEKVSGYSRTLSSCLLYVTAFFL